MSQKTSSKFSVIIKKITDAANKAVKNRESLKTYQKNSPETINELPNLKSFEARIV